MSDRAAPRTGMVLAAGLGTRMRPLTLTTAKPLLPLAGATLLDHALDRLIGAGVEHAVVNAHWHAGQVAAHLARRTRPGITVLEEPALLDTGGGVRAALKLLGAGPFFIVNGDTFWLNGPRPALDRLAEDWRDDVDAILLVHRTFQVRADVGLGDFFLDEWGYVRRRAPFEVAPYVFAGVAIAHARLLYGMPQGAFGMNDAWDRAIEAGRLRALVHDGVWFHLSTPADLAVAQHALDTQPFGETR